MGSISAKTTVEAFATSPRHFSNACLVDSQLPMCLHITVLVKGTSDFAFYRIQSFS